MNKHQNIAITGAAGFLGEHIIQELSTAHDEGLIHINRLVLIDIQACDIPRHTDTTITIETKIADVRDLDSLKNALTDIDLLIHSASVIDWGNLSKQFIYDVNVRGTENILAACEANDVSKLIYTSTMDVLHGGDAITNGDESLPYPKRYNDTYAETKALAEQLILKMNSPYLKTSVIRPCGIYGPKDPYHITETINAIETGALKFRVGDGSANFQHVYVGNVAYSHALLAIAMLNGNDRVNGETYLITDDEAENFFDFLEPIVNDLGYDFPPRNRYIPYSFMYMIASCLEAVQFILKPIKAISLPVTRSSVKMLCKDLSFKTNKASEHFAYEPKFDKEQAFALTVDSFKKH